VVGWGKRGKRRRKCGNRVSRRLRRRVDFDRLTHDKKNMAMEYVGNFCPVVIFTNAVGGRCMGVGEELVDGGVSFD